MASFVSLFSSRPLFGAPVFVERSRSLDTRTTLVAIAALGAFCSFLLFPAELALTLLLGIGLVILLASTDFPVTSSLWSRSYSSYYPTNSYSSSYYSRPSYSSPAPSTNRSFRPPSNNSSYAPPPPRERAPVGRPLNNPPPPRPPGGAILRERAPVGKR